MNGCVVKLVSSNQDIIWHARPVVALALVEDPAVSGSLRGPEFLQRHRLDAFMEHPDHRGNVLVSEYSQAYVDEFGGEPPPNWEILPGTCGGDEIIHCTRCG